MGEVVAEDYGRAMVFKQYGIDFCCGGGRSMASACERAGVSYPELARALDEVETRENSPGSSQLDHHLLSLMNSLTPSLGQRLKENV